MAKNAKTNIDLNSIYIGIFRYTKRMCDLHFAT